MDPYDMRPSKSLTTRPHGAWLSTVSNGLLLDRRADQVAPLCPRAVIVLDVLVAEQVLESEPRMRAALADAAVGDHLTVSIDALIELLQRIGGLEGTVLVGRFRPRNIGRAGDMAAALRRLGHPWRRN